MIRFLLASSGALFLGSIEAFFLFVPMLSIATVVWILVGGGGVFPAGVFRRGFGGETRGGNPKL